MSYTEQERDLTPGQRARLNGYDARYEGKTIDQYPALFSRYGALAKAWREGWTNADEELK